MFKKNQTNNNSNKKFGDKKIAFDNCNKYALIDLIISFNNSSSLRVEEEKRWSFDRDNRIKNKLK